MIDTTQAHPLVVDLDTWDCSGAEPLTLEKVGTHLTGSIAVQRRRLPMTPVHDYCHQQLVAKVSRRSP